MINDQLFIFYDGKDVSGWSLVIAEGCKLSTEDITETELT